jgi:hypothetical protein
MYVTEDLIQFLESPELAESLKKCNKGTGFGLVTTVVGIVCMRGATTYDRQVGGIRL